VYHRDLTLTTEALLETWLDAANQVITGAVPGDVQQAQYVKEQALHAMIKLDARRRSGVDLNEQQALVLQQTLPGLIGMLPDDMRAALDERRRRRAEEIAQPSPAALSTSSPSPGSRLRPVISPADEAADELDRAAAIARAARTEAEAKAAEARRAQEHARVAEQRVEELARAVELAREEAEEVQETSVAVAAEAIRERDEALADERVLGAVAEAALETAAQSVEHADVAEREAGEARAERDAAIAEAEAAEREADEARAERDAAIAEAEVAEHEPERAPEKATEKKAAPARGDRAPRPRSTRTRDKRTP
jgi:hypothetical protein